MQEEELKETTKENIEIRDFSPPSENKYFSKLSIKEKTILDIATEVYHDKDLLQEAVEVCRGKEIKQSMVGYVSKNFGALLPKFPAIQSYYLRQIYLKKSKLKKARKK